MPSSVAKFGSRHAGMVSHGSTHSYEQEFALDLR